MTYCYLDTSVAVHALRGTLAAATWFDELTRDPHRNLVSSRILQTELTRVLRRDRRPVRERDAVLRHVAIVPVTESILTAAEGVTDHLKTLDSIHLATAVAVGSETVVVTHDANLARVAEAVGLATYDPLALR